MNSAAFRSCPLFLIFFENTPNTIARDLKFK